MSVLRKLLKLITAFLLLPLALFLSLYSLEQQGFFKISKINIESNALTSQRNFVAPKVQQLQLRMDKFKGISLWKAPMSQISESLKEEKWIKEFQLSREWPAGIKLTIQPDEVALLVLPASGNNSSISESSMMKPITKSGKILEKINSSQAPGVIVTHDSEFLSDQKVRDGGLNLLSALPGSGTIAAASVSEIGYDKKEGYWIKLLHSEIKVNFGEENFELKSARISQVVDYLDSRNLKARVIDANLSKKVLVRLQQNP